MLDRGNGNSRVFIPQQLLRHIGTIKDDDLNGTFGTAMAGVRMKEAQAREGVKFEGEHAEELYMDEGAGIGELSCGTCAALRWADIDDDIECEECRDSRRRAG